MTTRVEALLRDGVMTAQRADGALECYRQAEEQAKLAEAALRPDMPATKDFERHLQASLSHCREGMAMLSGAPDQMNLLNGKGTFGEHVARVGEAETVELAYQALRDVLHMVYACCYHAQWQTAGHARPRKSKRRKGGE